MASRKELEAKLTAQQKKAAWLLVENELEVDPERKKTQEEIAQEVGVTRMGLYKWRTQNKAFIEYKNMLADDLLSSMRALVYRQLMKTIMSPQPSIKGIDLYLRRFGLLTDKQVIEEHTANEQRTTEALKRELDELDQLLEDTEKDGE